MPDFSIRGSLTKENTKTIKKRLIDHLYDALKKQISELSMGLGSRIDIKQITKRFGVSDNPVRSALNRLAHEGLIKTVPRRGYFVVGLTSRDIEEIYDVRIILETYAIQNGVLDQVEEKKFQAVQRHLKDLSENFKQKQAEQISLHADKALHHGIMRMCRNTRIKRFYVDIDAFVQVIQSAFQTIHKKQVVQEHLDILKQLLKGDKEQTIKYLTKHLENAMKRNLEVLAAKSKLGVSYDYGPNKYSEER